MGFSRRAQDVPKGRSFLLLTSARESASRRPTWSTLIPPLTKSLLLNCRYCPILKEVGLSDEIQPLSRGGQH
jgi:hypothetical protein